MFLHPSTSVKVRWQATGPVVHSTFTQLTRVKRPVPVACEAIFPADRRSRDRKSPEWPRLRKPQYLQSDRRRAFGATGVYKGGKISSRFTDGILLDRLHNAHNSHNSPRDILCKAKEGVFLVVGHGDGIPGRQTWDVVGFQSLRPPCWCFWALSAAVRQTDCQEGFKSLSRSSRRGMWEHLLRKRFGAYRLLHSVRNVGVVRNFQGQSRE
jgi:hypothetical protein